MQLQRGAVLLPHKSCSSPSSPPRASLPVQGGHVEQRAAGKSDEGCIFGLRDKATRIICGPATAKTSAHQPLALILPATPCHLGPGVPNHPTCADIQADSRIPWQKWQLHDWLLEKYSRSEDFFLKLSGFPWPWTFSITFESKSTGNSPFMTTFRMRPSTS
ncbi:Galactoside 2-alpha-L-fucosyltransferase 1 [Sciurus carolinensis]|uniref:Galactoside 2-alpha-L-fucosyltransferase 1 n=1 Tax=Sciurus carolinensis TaxID=30640 RepID=A0AA41NBF0_SCICA|nr:Galactoside 2-alpha-L-fucosyltransferase 1 [Sciurus carolinensis]